MRRARLTQGMTTIKQAGIVQLICFFTLILTTGDLHGQQKDFGTWWEFELSGRMQNKLQISGEIEQRMKENSLQFDRTLLTLGANYDVLDYLNLEAGFRTLFITDPENRLNSRYRLHMDATGHHTFNRTQLSLRLRFQYGFEDILYFGSFSENSFASRQRLKLVQSFYGSRFGVFASLENWVRFNDLYGRPLNKMRLVLGTNYKLGRQSKIGLRYIFENEFNRANPRQVHVLALSYAYSL